MSYQVLARKWRPRSFENMVGQEHVLPALVHALEHNRLHHAYLFTGTRGIGKTTVARIFAKCLNCETGITATPCNKCPTCQEIDEGRFIDLIEVDAASRTKVEDTRELLENVQYAPSKGRFKVYLIDEVHMLSGHSFNALLKTLEEPPEHVKFLLATTDPEKLPITVLSRCLQFHLKPLTQQQIESHLEFVLNEEKIPFEQPALHVLADAANGSLRDSLSLLDQAIAFSDGSVKEQEICDMLGVVNKQAVLDLLTALENKDAEALMKTSNDIAAQGYDFAKTLENLSEAFHQISINQFIENQHPNLQSFADNFSKEAVQLYYQICVIGKKDLPLAPNSKIGFEMVLLRLLAFKPGAQAGPARASAPSRAAQPVKTAAPAAKPQAPTPNVISTEASTTKCEPSGEISMSDWGNMIAGLNIKGMLLAIANHCDMIEQTDKKITLALAPEHAPLLNENVRKRLEDSINQALSKSLRLDIKIADEKLATPSSITQKNAEIALDSATKNIESDSHIKQLRDKFGAKLQNDSIEAVGDGNK